MVSRSSVPRASRTPSSAQNLGGWRVRLRVLCIASIRGNCSYYQRWSPSRNAGSHNQLSLIPLHLARSSDELIATTHHTVVYSTTRLRFDLCCSATRTVSSLLRCISDVTTVVAAFATIDCVSIERVSLCEKSDSKNRFQNAPAWLVLVFIPHVPSALSNRILSCADNG